MQTIKLHEATKQFKISNKLAMYFLETRHLAVKSHSSVISMEQLELLREFSENLKKYDDIVKEFNRLAKEKKKKVKKEEVEVEIKVTEEKATTDIKKEPEPELEPAKPTPAPPPPVTVEPRPVEAPKPPPVRAEPATIRVTAKRAEVPPAKRESAKAPIQVKKEISEPKPAPERPKPAPAKPPVDSRHFVNKQRPRMRMKRPPSRHSHGQYKGIKKSAPPPIIPKKKPKLEDIPELIQVSDNITLKELSEKLNLKLRFVEEKLDELKLSYNSNQIMRIEDVTNVCKAFNVELDVISYEEYIYINNIEKSKDQLASRPPVVTIMGHVDHGKTTLLDTLRNTKVAEQEAGGITQSIGAYKLKLDDKEIIFIDTPGHEAFTNLRARGAKVTDLIVLVVAANDGVQPQTVEAINHALAAEVPIVVAINKIDLNGAEPDRVKQELSKHNIVVEDWGGDVVSVAISAKNNQNLDSLMEMISLTAELKELTCYKKIPARGTIIESRLDPKLGPVGTILLQQGLLKKGDYFICGNAVGKAKSIFDDRRKTMNSSQAPAPVEIMGFEELPSAGDLFQVVNDIEKARKVITIRKQKEKDIKKDEVMAEKKVSLQNLFQKLQEKKAKGIPIILKTDNFGSLEVLERILAELSHEKVEIDIVQKGIGNVSEGDILLAATAKAAVIGFNVKTPQKIVAIAKREQIEVRLYNVIYHLTEDISKAIEGEIEPEYEETFIGKIEVLQKFKISKMGNIAGCLVREGKITNKSRLKVLRNDDLVFEGELETLKRIKDEVSEVKAGTECGIKIKNFNDIEVGDILEAYELTLKK